jgi:hypothetical protein
VVGGAVGEDVGDRDITTRRVRLRARRPAIAFRKRSRKPERLS